MKNTFKNWIGFVVMLMMAFASFASASIDLNTWDSDVGWQVSYVDYSIDIESKALVEIGGQLFVPPDFGECVPQSQPKMSYGIMEEFKVKDYWPLGNSKSRTKARSEMPNAKYSKFSSLKFGKGFRRLS